jgi:hypothetical protein
MTFLSRSAAMPLLLCLEAIAPSAVRAQYASPPQVLVIREYVDDYKNVPGYNWATYQQVFGTNYYAYLFVARYKSLSEVDDAWGFGGSATKTFDSAHGDSGLKKLHALQAIVVDSEMTNVFRIRPEMSRPMDEVIKAEPTFWSPTTASKP